jgi:diaminohydroxyphosphoribosylaminopyrimidine deaminase/5-amino-6-(5-phosphoribosylamino)uracil reductase
MDDSQFMKMALDLAVKGIGYTSPNPMVGAIVVKDGRVVGNGYHQAVGGPHAEVNAIDAAGPHAEGATLYVTLEPCNHTGRTPPCTKKILEAGIQRVVIAIPDPNPAVAGGGAKFLEQQGVRITTGICQQQASRLNEAFIKFSRTRRPFVIAKCASTLDGRIASRSGDSKWVTGDKARQFVHRLRHAVDGILVGINTVRIDDPSLTTRLPDHDGKDPVRIILDTRLDISPQARLLQQTSDAETIIVAGRNPEPGKIAALKKVGGRVLNSELKNGLIDLVALMDKLGAMGLSSILIEGGSRVLSSALKSGIVDKVFFFYAPKILGGDDGIPICSGPGPDLISDSIPVNDIEVRRFGDDVMIEGYIGFPSVE